MMDLIDRMRVLLARVDWLDLGLTAAAMVLAFYCVDIWGVLFFFVALSFTKIVTGRISK